jgi:ABC-type Fe3+-hydroxamate transport system substrate-binding protein
MNAPPLNSINPKRIISVVPSQTELLYDLGLEDEVIGITKFCIHPESWFKKKSRVGGTKNLDLNKIHSLSPDLIIANREENVKEQIEELQKQYPVYVSDIKNIQDALDMIRELGHIVNRDQESEVIIENIRSQQNAQSLPKRKRTIYLIWKNPYMAAGKETFIDAMLEEAGFENCILTSRYPIMTLETMKELKPELILLSSEPYPFLEKDAYEFQTFLPQTKVLQVDGELFSWYGSRMSKSFEYFRALNAKL